jgi:hypothetical protein
MGTRKIGWDAMRIPKRFAVTYFRKSGDTMAISLPLCNHFYKKIENEMQS